MRPSLVLLWVTLCGVGCAPLQDASQVRDERLLHVAGVVEGLSPGPHDEGLRIGTLWLAGDGGRWVGASAPAVADGDRYVFDLEIRDSTRTPSVVHYQPGWWVGYFVLFWDNDGDRTAKLVGTSFGNDRLVGASPVQLVYAHQPEALPPIVDAGADPFYPSTFLVDDSAAGRGYHLAAGLCPDEGVLLRADVIPDDTLIHVVYTGDTKDWYPHGRIPGGCLGL